MLDEGCPEYGLDRGFEERDEEEDEEEGDDEDESDNEDEYYEYFSDGEDDIVDVESPHYVPPFGFQHYVLEQSTSESSPTVLDYVPESEGSAHSDDGHVHYSTDDGAM